MKQDPIVITAILKAKSGREDELFEALKEVIEPSRTEAGCLQYDLHRSTDDPSVFVFYERWKDEDAVQDHVASEHYQAYRERGEELVESREVYKLRLV
ncbi:monooxygenase [Bacillus coahuilensis p1.1.43]|uniref:Monooxygenase n=1 Tax=Bacillus coahuilensis p1.1.43 TaxID=1150625 RepID=A0A147KCT4_9BACI|nr:putative quinol monooxygenase [Bacillus coahuilensis]KUP09494.1 monooxygenase [Bacillus coahuilensis p1.1.43]